MIVFKITQFLSTQGLENALSTCEKAQVVESTHAQFVAGAADLQKVLKLSKYVDFDAIIDLESR